MSEINLPLDPTALEQLRRMQERLGRIEAEHAALLAVLDAAQAAVRSLDDVEHDVFPVFEASLRKTLATYRRITGEEEGEEPMPREVLDSPEIKAKIDKAKARARRTEVTPPATERDQG